MADVGRLIKKTVERLLLLVLVVLSLGAAGLIVLRMNYGRGEPYLAETTRPELSAQQLETLVALDFPPGNVTTSPDGRVFFGLHPFARAERFTGAFVFELLDGKPVPFPDDARQAKLSGVLGMTVDGHNRLWLVSPASLDDQRTRLMGIDLATGETVLEHAQETGLRSFIQDLRVSPDGKTIFLADAGTLRLTPAALLVFDVERRSMRRVLEGHPSVSAQDYQIMTSQGPFSLFHGLVTFAAGVDGLALSPDGKWLYYAAMNHDTLYRIPTAGLVGAADDATLAGQIERVGSKPLSNGIEVDGDGTVYVTDVENGSIVKVTPSGKTTTVIEGADVVWPDGVAITKTGQVLFTDSAIPAFIDPMMQPPAKTRLDQAGPYHIYRFTLPRPVAVPDEEAVAEADAEGQGHAEGEAPTAGSQTEQAQQAGVLASDGPKGSVHQGRRPAP